jgi:hypothetical protein
MVHTTKLKYIHGPYKNNPPVVRLKQQADVDQYKINPLAELNFKKYGTKDVVKLS